MTRCAVALFCAAALSAPAARAADLDPHLPPDTERYLTIDVKQIVTSAAGKKLGKERLKELLENLPDTTALLKQLGLDAVADVDRIQLCAPADNDAKKGLLVLTGRFDAKKLDKQAEDAEAVKAHREKIDKADVTVYEMKKVAGGLFVAVPDNKTLLASGGKEYVVAALRQARAAKKPPLKDRDVQAVLEKLDPKLGAGVVMRGGALPKHELLDFVPKVIRNVLDKVGVIGGGATFTDEVKFDLVGSARSEEDAKLVRDTVTNALNLLKTGLGFLGNDNRTLTLVRETLDTARMGGRERVVTFTARLTADVLGDFTKD